MFKIFYKKLKKYIWVLKIKKGMPAFPCMRASSLVVGLSSPEGSKPP